MLTREKAYALINLTGLVLGLTTVLLAFVFIRDEQTYDRFHAKNDRIFRLNKWVVDPAGDRFRTAESPGLMAPTMVDDFPEVRRATRLLPWFDEVLLTYGDRNVSTTGFSCWRAF